jgi:hypothetical protein
MARRKWDHEVHKYNRVVFNSKRAGETIIWRCVLPNCQHYLVGEMVVGKLCVCNRCNDGVFEMKRAHLTKKKPHCLSCTKQYAGKKRQPTGIAEIVNNLEALLKVD